MGILKISEELHGELRLSSKVMSRSINAQAEHWIKIGMLAEFNPTLGYTELVAMLMENPDISVYSLSQKAVSA
ncbi:ParD-like family protein [Gynuella sp.]|uniref:ParD-like family protein n=1 Tax=Gynuella sp. TaxID=2969146 RepID=UPI003D13FBD6